MSNPVSIVGTIATDPRFTRGDSRVPLCSFRVASNERRYDREKGEWIDSLTNWFTVTAFRGLAEHARDSLSKGDRVIVQGRLRVRHWEANGKSGTAVEIDADALGHDLRFGVSSFAKRTNGAAAGGSGDADSATADAGAEAGVGAAAIRSGAQQGWNTPVASEGRSLDGFDTVEDEAAAA